MFYLFKKKNFFFISEKDEYNKYLKLMNHMKKNKDIIKTKNDFLEEMKQNFPSTTQPRKMKRYLEQENNQINFGSGEQYDNLVDDALLYLMIWEKDIDINDVEFKPKPFLQKRRLPNTNEQKPKKKQKKNPKFKILCTVGAKSIRSTIKPGNFKLVNDVIKEHTIPIETMMKPNSKSLVCVVVDKKIEKFPIQQLESYAGYENGKGLPIVNYKFIVEEKGDLVMMKKHFLDLDTCKILEITVLENLEPEKGKIQNELEKLESQDCENIAELKKTIENMEQYWNLMIEIKQMQSKKQNIVVVEKHGKVYLCVNDDFSLQTNTLTTSSFKITFQEIKHVDLPDEESFNFKLRYYIRKRLNQKIYGDNLFTTIDSETKQSLKNDRKCSEEEQLSLLFFVVHHCTYVKNIFEKLNQTPPIMKTFYSRSTSFIRESTNKVTKMGSHKTMLTFAEAFQETNFKNNIVFVRILKNILIGFGASEDNLLSPIGKTSNTGEEAVDVAITQKEAKKYKKEQEEKEFKEMILKKIEDRIDIFCGINNNDDGDFIIKNQNVKELFEKILNIEDGALVQYAKSIARSSYTITLINITDKEVLIQDFINLGISKSIAHYILKEIKPE